MQGEYCEIDTNECRSSPCLNGATCYNLLNDYGCICTPGYTDYNCNSDVDECVIGICGEKGHCLVCSILLSYYYENIIYTHTVPSFLLPPSLSRSLSLFLASFPNSCRTYMVATFVPVTLGTLGPTVMWTLTNVPPNPARMEQPAL